MSNRKLTDEQTVQLLKDAEKGDTPMDELCREDGISEATFSTLRRQSDGTNVNELKRLTQLEAENARLLKLVGQLTLENNAMKEVVRKKR